MQIKPALDFYACEQGRWTLAPVLGSAAQA